MSPRYVPKPMPGPACAVWLYHRWFQREPWAILDRCARCGMDKAEARAARAAIGPTSDGGMNATGGSR